jgi:hypothetical protein
VSPSPRKTVSFTQDTKVPEDSKPSDGVKKAAKKPKEKKKKKPVETPTEPFNLEPSLNYLRQWHTDRESWKFNKNHQTLLIKACFDAGRIPAADVPTFLLYIRDLKGFVRTRLREEAAEIKKKDMEQGAAGFPQAKEKEVKESKQQLYEEVLSKLLQLGQQEEDSGAPPNGNGKRSFDETEFTARDDMDIDVKQRAIKRMRAEMVLQELSDSEESTTSAASGVTTTTTSSSSQAETVEPVREKRVKLNDGSQQLKRRRLRKSRTADISDSESSSDSESDSDSSNSSSSSSDDEEDEEMPLVNGLDGAESSSSSSSSSESGSDDDDSDSESESGAGARVERDESSSSSESEDSDDE